MVSYGDSSNADESLSKLELRGEDYKQASIFAIQKKQQERMKWQVIGKAIALVFVLGFLLIWYLISS